MIDAVIVCCPPAFHFEIVKHFLEEGVHVLCEKPLTIASDEAVQLVELSERNRLREPKGLRLAAVQRQANQSAGFMQVPLTN